MSRYENALDSKPFYQAYATLLHYCGYGFVLQRFWRDENPRLSFYFIFSLDKVPRRLQYKPHFMIAI